MGSILQEQRRFHLFLSSQILWTLIKLCADFITLFFAPNYFSVELDSKLSILYSQYFKSIQFELSMLCHYFLSPNMRGIKTHNQVSGTSTILNLKLPAKILQYLLHGDLVVVVLRAVSTDFCIYIHIFPCNSWKYFTATKKKGTLLPFVFKAELRSGTVLPSVFGKVPGGARSTPALPELTAPGWGTAERRIVLPALRELSAPVEPPSQLCAQCKYATHAAVAVQAQKKMSLSGCSEHFWF